MNKTLNNIFKGDKVIWMIFLFLCIISVIEVYSASSQLTYRNGSYIAPMMKHVGLLGLGLLSMVVTMNIPCKYFKVATPILLIASLVLLVGVFFAGAINDGHRWINILGMSFQPSEIAKGTLVLGTAQILSATQTENGADKHAFGYITFMCLPIVALIATENLSTAALICMVIFMMMIIGRIPIYQIGRLLGVLALGIVLVVALTKWSAAEEARRANGQIQTETLASAGNAEAGDAKAEKDESTASGFFHRFDTWSSRFTKFVDGKAETPAEVDLEGEDAQRAHANIAIVTSEFYGKGPGNSEECDFLPQAFSDFIYAIIIEEMGIEGAVFVALLYILLLIRTGVIASRCEKSFPAFFAMGLALMLVTQALINMCVAVGVLPITGQPLPLISKGGTSTVINCIYLGAILSISRTATKRKDSPEAGNGTPAMAAQIAAK